MFLHSQTSPSLLPVKPARLSCLSNRTGVSCGIRLWCSTRGFALMLLASGLRFLPGHCRRISDHFSASVYSFCLFTVFHPICIYSHEGSRECGECCIAATQLAACLCLELLLLVEMQVSFFSHLVSPCCK